MVTILAVAAWSLLVLLIWLAVGGAIVIGLPWLAARIAAKICGPDEPSTVDPVDEHWRSVVRAGMSVDLDARATRQHFEDWEHECDALRGRRDY